MSIVLRVFSAARLRLRSLVFRTSVERDLEEELQNHLALETVQQVEAGLSEGEARLQAERSMGAIHVIKERCRDMQGLNWLDDLMSDVKYALHSFRHHPGFAAAAIAILALGIGSTTAVFSAVDRLLFKSMPYSAPKELVSFGFSLPFMSYEFVFGTVYLDWLHEPLPFTNIGAWSGVAACDLTEEQPRRMNCAVVDTNFLPTLGIPLQLGRNFAREDDDPHGGAVGIISDALWRGRFGGDPNIVGRVVNIDGSAVRITGVLPPAFELPNLADADVLMPQPLPGAGPGVPLRVIGRLKQGITLAQARSQLEPITKQFKQSAPANLRSQIAFGIQYLADQQTANIRRTSIFLFGTVSLILFIACANVANLLLARAISRQKEIAVRTALGAGKNRLTRQLLTESVLLSVLGGSLGCVLARLLLSLFKLLAPTAVPRLSAASIDSRVLVFAAGVSVANGLLFGLIPAFMALPSEALAGRTVHTVGGHSLRRLLTSSQVALSLILLMLSAVFLDSLWKLSHVSLGINPDNVVLAELALNASRYSKPAAQESFLSSLITEVRALPGVKAAAISDTVPPGGFVHTRPIDVLQVPGRNLPTGTGQIIAWRTVSPGYFRALGIQLLRGRAFSDKDEIGTDYPIVLSRSLSRQLFGSIESVGKIANIVAQQVIPATVIGVAADVKNDGPASAAVPEYYVLRKANSSAGNVQNSLPVRVLNASGGTVTLIVRGEGTPQGLSAMIRSAAEHLDKTLPLQFTTLRSNISRLSERPRLEAALLSLFGLIALILAAIGIYGLTSFFVAQRVAEIGLRMAVGASPRMILALFLKEALRWLGIGIAVGAILIALVSRFVSCLLFKTSVLNPPLFLAVACLLILAGVLAALFPSRRASAVDPLVALRQE